MYCTLFTSSAYRNGPPLRVVEQRTWYYLCNPYCTHLLWYTISTHHLIASTRQPRISIPVLAMYTVSRPHCLLIGDTSLQNRFACWVDGAVAVARPCLLCTAVVYQSHLVVLLKKNEEDDDTADNDALRTPLSVGCSRLQPFGVTV